MISNTSTITINNKNLKTKMMELLQSTQIWLLQLKKWDLTLTQIKWESFNNL